MTLFVRLADVPSEILELVKARILANRKRNRQKPPAVLPSSQTPRRRYYNPQAADRRPEPGAVHVPLKGTTGMAWVVHPSTSFFGAPWWWGERAPGNLPSPLVDGAMPIRVGSGDGSTWVNASLSLPVEGAFSPESTALQPVGVVGPGDVIIYVYNEDPTGKITQVSRNYIDDSYLLKVAFPCGNGAAIVLVAARAAGSSYGFIRRAGLSYEWYGGWQTYWHLATTIPEAPVTVCAQDMAAFVVSQTGCRQVSIPAGLSEAMATLWPDTTWRPGVPFAGVAPTLLPDNRGEYWYQDTEYTGKRKLESALITKTVRGYATSESAMGGYVPIGGYGILEATTFSPGVFSLFTNYDATFDAFDFRTLAPDRETTGLTGFRLTELGAPAPYHWLTVDAKEPGLIAITDDFYNGSTGDQERAEAIFNSSVNKVNIVKSKQMPATVFDVLPEDAPWARVKSLPLAEGRTVPGGIADPFYEVIWHYDWGEPAYCRQQLLALGFSPADLTP